jgi:heme oxygenase
LKQATAAVHARLDARLGALDLQSAGGYRQFLEINASALLPLERALTAAGVRELLPDWDRRVRAGAVLSDLAALGGKPYPLEAPPMPDRLAMLGTLYVLEGSRLGAAYLLKTVARCSDPVVSRNTSFLAHGAGQDFWSSFLSVLERTEAVDADDLISPARRAFDLFAESARVLS